VEPEWFDISLDAGRFCRWSQVLADLAAAPGLSPRIARVTEDGSVQLRLDASPKQVKHALSELCALSKRHELSLNGSPCGQDLFRCIHESFLSAQDDVSRHALPDVPPLLWIPDAAFKVVPLIGLALMALWLLGAFRNCMAP
jgi:hypothetical protein